jgi:predicted lipoprotein with Yx(FWY)xxD motif
MADTAPPPYTAPVPVEISVFFETGRYVFRTDDSLVIYSYDKDVPGKSNCDATCAKTWLPVAGPIGAKTIGEWTTIERPGKTWQWTYRGKPVYTYARDPVGKATGDGAEGGLWHVVYP